MFLFTSTSQARIHQFYRCVIILTLGLLGKKRKKKKKKKPKASSNSVPAVSYPEMNELGELGEEVCYVSNFDGSGIVQLVLLLGKAAGVRRRGGSVSGYIQGLF